MSNRLAALLLALIVAGPAAAGPVEIEAAPQTPSAPFAVSAAGAAAPIAGAAALAPALTAGVMPALAAPAAPALAASAAFVPAAAPAAAPVAAYSVSAAPAADASPAAATLAAAPSERGAAPANALAAARAAQGLPAGALFDGSRSAAAAEPVRAAENSSVPLAVPSEKELETLFAAAKPKSPAVAMFGRMGGFAEAASQLVSQYTFVNVELLRDLKASPYARGPQGPAFVQSVKDLTAVADARQDPASRRFLEALGRYSAAQFYAQEMMAAKLGALGMIRPGAAAQGRHMPRNALGSGDYWDMAAGMNAGGFILKELEPGTRYTFFDLSPFVVSYLDAVAQMKGADVSVAEGDVLKLRRPANPLSVLRTKNAVAYVPGFEDKLAEMADWVAPGGRLVVQNDPMAGQRQLIVQKHGPLALRLLEQGWDFSFEFESQPGARHALDTLIFTRPKGAVRARTPADARALWRRYVDATAQANQADMLRLFFR